MIPCAVHKICENGWKTHIPYTNLTDAACCNEYQAMRQEEQTVRIGAEGQAITTAPDLSPNDPAEALLTFTEYLQATRRHSLLIREYQPDLQEYWDDHVDIVFNHLCRDTHWPVVLRYDIEIRKRSCNSAINPGIYQELIFTHLMDQVRDKALDLYKTAPQAAHQKSFQSNAASTSTAHTRQNQYTSRSTQKTPTTLPSTSLPATPPGPRGRCYRCGLTGHAVRLCTQETLANGRTPNITRGRKGAWFINGGTFCYKFNSVDGCIPSECKNPPHVCTLCNATDHGAQNCRA
jgi:hypothetical protein